MSTWSLRAAMVPITRRVRAYFAPINREADISAIFDPGKHGAFPLDSPPAPWIDLGWIEYGPPRGEQPLHNSAVR